MKRIHIYYILSAILFLIWIALWRQSIFIRAIVIMTGFIVFHLIWNEWFHHHSSRWIIYTPSLLMTCVTAIFIGIFILNRINQSSDGFNEDYSGVFMGITLLLSILSFGITTYLSKKGK